MDGLAGAHREGVAGYGQNLVDATDQMHLHPAVGGIPDRPVIEGRRIDPRSEFAIDPGQEVEVEGRGDALGVVIGGDQDRLSLDQIRADDELGPLAQQPAS